MSVLVAVGLQSLTARGATEEVQAARGADSAAVNLPLTGIDSGAGQTQDDSTIYLPLTNKDGVAPSPSATTTVTPTTTITPTIEPSPTPTVTIAADLFVDDTNTTDTQDGSAEHPYANVQAAIDAASGNAITVAVAAGVYSENILIQDKTVHLYGGFVGGTLADYSSGDGGNFTDRNPTTNVSHLQGDKTDSVVTLVEAGASTVDGFRITNGTRSLIPEFGDRGGGIFVSGGAPTISYNLIENNDTRPPGSDGAEPLGGGIFAQGADIAILNNTIRKNISGRGGGIAIDGGIITIRGNTVQENSGGGPTNGDHGGGVYVFSPHAEISHNLIIGNEIGREENYGWGGGILVYGQGSFARLSFNTITENYAPSIGSGVFIDEGAIAILDHELIYNNQCPDGGTTGGVGLYVDGNINTKIGSHVTVLHTTITSHNCPTQGGNGLYVEAYSGVTVTNSIFWGNSNSNSDEADDIFVDETSQITFTYTIAEKAITGEGNLSVDPLFANPAQHDYHLRSTAGRWDPTANDGDGGFVIDANHSPAIDAADPASAFANEPTPNGARANLGVYGNTAEASKSSP